MQVTYPNGDRVETRPEPCAVCGDTTDRCSFMRACSCWRGVPCVTVPEWVRRAQSGTLPASDRTAGR